MLVIPRKKRRMRSPAERVKTPYGLEVVENYLTYPLPKDRLFRNLPQAVRAELGAISSSAAYGKGEILFAEGQAPRGVFVICKGRVKLSANSADGKSLILHMAAQEKSWACPERFPENVMRPQPKRSSLFRPTSSLGV